MMRSPINPFPKARYSSAFSSKIIVKDYVVAAYLNDRLFLAPGHSLKKISSKISCEATPKIKQHCYPFLAPAILY